MTPRYWRSLQERDAVERGEPREFPEGATEMDGATRRDFLKLLGGTAAVAGLAGTAGCFTNPPDAVLPYARSPEGVTPSNPLHYATTLTLDGYGVGVIVTSQEGRPIKVEGNPDHPASLGGTSVFEQAAVWHLYDPQRARGLKNRGKPFAWRSFLGDVAGRLPALARDRGKKLRFLVEANGSPLEASLRARILAAFPEARFHAWSGTAQDHAYEGTKLFFGRPLEVHPDFERARVIVSLDGDFLGDGPERLRHAREFARHRVPDHELNRLYVAEARLTTTGAQADHRLRVRSSDVHALALQLLEGVRGSTTPANAWLKAAAADLKKRGAQALVVTGRAQPPAVHAIVAAINHALGSEAVTYTKPALNDTATGPAALRPLLDEIDNGAVDTLVVTAYNPVYTAPADLDLAARLRKVPNVVYRGLFVDETAHHTGWFLPAAHELESWGDARAADGTISFQQPLTNPLWNGVTTSEVLAAFVGSTENALFQLKSFWATQQKTDFESWWNHTVQRGLVTDSAFAKENVTPSWDAIGKLPAPAAAGGLEVRFRPDARVYDGRFGDNAWLQELPDPISKLTWSNALEVSPKTAARLGLANESTVKLTVAGKSVDAPVMVLPGHADESVTLSLGYGRSGAEMIARSLGVDANRLRTAAAPWFAGASLIKLDRKWKLAVTQDHWSMEGRPIALEVTAAELTKKHLPLIDEMRADHPSMYPPHEYKGLKWGMAIDMSRCTGCEACMVACASENNTLVVGAEQIRKSREMHWIRVDRYFSGSIDDPETVMQPMACVHCENAPCEYVCPVNATVHSDEGLNEMVYNRCVGTRYCSNNCPYKVRRFNYLNWHKNLPGTEEMAMNPNVSVRARGVMEKCTYCVQRIERWRIDSRVEGREYKDGEFTSACAQACPSQAIVFGSLHDKNTAVSKQHADPRSYRVLNELNTRPRTQHLARVRNKNPELA